jgi:hypothetical protein
MECALRQSTNCLPKQRVPVQIPFFYWARRIRSIRCSAVDRGFNSLSNAIRFICGNISEKKYSLLDHRLYAPSLCDRKRSFFSFPSQFPKTCSLDWREGHTKKNTMSVFVCLWQVKVKKNMVPERFKGQKSMISEGLKCLKKHSLRKDLNVKKTCF